MYLHCNNMKVPLIRIGNSRGVRIPKPLIEECQLSDEVDLQVKDNSIVISSITAVRSKWEDAFQRMSNSGDDRLLDVPVITDWDETDWQWK